MPLLDHKTALVTQALWRRAVGVCAVPAREHAGRAGAAGRRHGRARGRHRHPARLRPPGPGADAPWRPSRVGWVGYDTVGQ